MNTLHRCGNHDPGEFNFTLTVTAVSSSWTFLFPLCNKAHDWIIACLNTSLKPVLFLVFDLYSVTVASYSIIPYSTGTSWSKLLHHLQPFLSQKRQLLR
jgi:hypothetical protein